MKMSESNKQTFVKNRAYYEKIAPGNKLFQDLSRHADEFNEAMKDPLEQLSYWKIERDRAQKEIDTLTEQIVEDFRSDHDCGSGYGDSCVICYRYGEVIGYEDNYDDVGD